MRFDILTLFPEMFAPVLKTSILGNAQEKGLLTFNIVNIRDFSTDKHRRVDDYIYGGGKGMLMMVQPIYDAYQSLVSGLSYKPLTIYLSPQGRPFCQQVARELSDQEHVILLCGHYEGVDERILEEIVDMELSLGDFVLTGGEIPAMAVVDAVSRLIPGVLADEVCYSDETFEGGLVEYPQYTRPPEILGRRVPEVLLSGHHANIEAWRREQSYLRTRKKRPDLLQKSEEKGTEENGNKKNKKI